MSSGADYNRMEELQARRDGATLVKNSGRGERKGDARRGNLLIDYKFTEKKSYALNLADFTKHYMDAFRESYEGVVVAIFTPSQKKIAMVDWEYLLSLEDEAHNLRLELEDYKYRYESVSK